MYIDKVGWIGMDYFVSFGVGSFESGVIYVVFVVCNFVFVCFV